jgi:hypothetical protein
MESFKAGAVPYIAVQHSLNHEVKIINFEQLMAAYHQHQNALQHHE